MKVKAEIVIDADRETIWRHLDRAAGKPLWRPTTVTEKRSPDFIAGVYESASRKAVVVNHFQTIDENHTRWIVFANHRVGGLAAIRSLLGRNTLARETEDDMQRFKLLVESRIAERTT